MVLSSGKPLLLISVDNTPTMSHTISAVAIVKAERIFSVETISFDFVKNILLLLCVLVPWLDV